MARAAACHRVRGDKSLAKLVRKKLPHVPCSPHEIFGMVTIDAKGCATVHELFRGEKSHVLVYPSKVIEVAKAAQAERVAFFHNHPSGWVTPSSEDEDTTSRLRWRLKGNGISVRRHMILVEAAEGFCENARWDLDGFRVHRRRR